ncbi:PLAC8-domain-containing protein [Mycena pura]|uniref:PLAC8-domain-containing protein n=1 Tax=Mycena pura TaxID=153505 RepID=A0AAD6UM78_9AGAR|nr:PLAC8-domain-containing protein [Mycena pura]
MEVAVGGSRNFKGLPLVDGERGWSNGVLDCFADPLTLLVSWAAPCLVYGRNRARYRALESPGEVSRSAGEGLASGDSLLYCVAMSFGCGACIGMRGRSLTRRRYGIRGTACGDCCVSCCCAPCALTQESREIELEEQSLGHPGAGFSALLK